MPSSIRTILQHALLIAAPSLIGCGGDRHTTFTISDTWTDGGAVGTVSDHLCLAFCADRCVSNVVDCSAVPTADGGISIDCHSDPIPTAICGRRPAGLARVAARGSALGAHFASAAHLEAASVVAFERLAGELRGHGAPAGLVSRSQRAARDEVRHARSMGQLARRFGAQVPPVRVAAPGARSLADLALENAVEGCVHESFGAAVGAWQAGAARDGRIRRSMAAVAVDEAAHAQLAWDLDAWLQTRLGRAERRRVAAARSDAADAMLHSDPAPELMAQAGLPSAAASQRLHGALSAQLWHA